ncbi:MAG: phosphoribosyltransferase family protein [Patescibacteria group bacterium]
MYFFGTEKHLTKLFDWCLDWVWPRYCLGCWKEGEWVCGDCLKEKIITDTNFCCPECRLENGNGGVCVNCRAKWNLDHLLVACCPTELLREILLQYKYKDIYRLTDVLAFFLTKKLDKVGEKYDCVTFVPLHSKRERWRGYNQSAILAKILAKNYNIAFAKIMYRWRFGSPQVNFDRVGRKKNVEGVFAMMKKMDLSGKKILVVDDVCTTGATINECARILKENGAEQVDGLVVVRGTMKK